MSKQSPQKSVSSLTGESSDTDTHHMAWWSQWSAWYLLGTKVQHKNVYKMQGNNGKLYANTSKRLCEWKVRSYKNYINAVRTGPLHFVLFLLVDTFRHVFCLKFYPHNQVYLDFKHHTASFFVPSKYCIRQLKNKQSGDLQERIFQPNGIVHHTDCQTVTDISKNFIVSALWSFKISLTLCQITRHPGKDLHLSATVLWKPQTSHRRVLLINECLKSC
jgi:hypothetical protein